MTDLIKKVLLDAGVSLWRINRTETETAELFFIRHRLDVRRATKTEKYNITVFRDIEQNGKMMRGSSSVLIVPATDEADIRKAIDEALYSASFALNPLYDMPNKETSELVIKTSDIIETTLEEGAMKMAEAMFSAETCSDAWVNSAEFFLSSVRERIITSYGTNVAYSSCGAEGEFIVQCKEPQDVEMYHAFAYDRLDTDALRRKTADALSFVRDRARAKANLPGGVYNLILSGSHLEELLSYYGARSDASMIYSKYSSYQIGTEVQSKNAKGEKLNLTLRAIHPFSESGVPMCDRSLFSNGKMQLIHGVDRFCSYLGVPMTGKYTAFSCDNGSVSFEDMKKSPYLYVVSFSDFQMDYLSGHFGGEIRLAYLFDGKTTQIVTGGSVNGSITDCSDDLLFSKERYDSLSYSGPFAIRLCGVKVAGSESQQ